jgi:hypothetical protein
MKVLDLQCVHGHAFEGWFACEEDFVAQCAESLVQCPLCGDSAVVKKLSAPRLNLGAKRPDPSVSQLPAVPVDSNEALTNAWLAVARQVVANTTDVGSRFAEEARKMHYGEKDERAIRGQASMQEARALMDEGIDVMPFLLPNVLKDPLQ